MKAAASFLILICIGLGFLAYRQTTVLKRQQELVSRLNAQLNSLSKTEQAFHFQERCAKQAREEFKLYGWDKQKFAQVSSHYNARLNKCFMQIRDTEVQSGTIITSQEISDAFEGKVYGNYIFGTEKNKKYWGVPPLECDVTLLSGEQKTCHSSDEFDALIKQYME